MRYAHLTFVLVLTTAITLFLFLSLGLQGATRLTPMVVAIPTLGFLTWEIVKEIRSPQPDNGQSGNFGFILWFVAFVAACQVLDGVLAVPVFILLSLRYWAKSTWTAGVGVSLAALLVLRLSFPHGLAHPPLF